MAKEGLRPIGFSQDLIEWGNRRDKKSNALKKGQKIILESIDYPDDSRCNGEFIVSDAMNIRYKNKGDIFFLDRKDNISCNANIYIINQ